MYIYWNTHAYDTVLLLPQWKTLSYLPEAQNNNELLLQNQNIFMLLETIKKQLVTSN
jgi:hypothetical protein